MSKRAWVRFERLRRRVALVVVVAVVAVGVMAIDVAPASGLERGQSGTASTVARATPPHRSPPGVATAFALAVAPGFAPTVAPTVAPAGSLAAPSAAALTGWLSQNPASAYRPPVQGTIVDRFRPPPNPYGAGNRGLDYRTVPLSAVVASNDGEVIFAAQVGGGLHITIRHADGLRTSYSFLATVLVRAGQRVRGGEVIGETGEFFHFGVRDTAGTYLDPEALFGARLEVHLVPSGDDGATPTAAAATEPAALTAVVRERLGPLSKLLTTVGGVRLAPADALHRLKVIGHYAVELRAETHAARFAQALGGWYRRRDDCTPPDVGPPRPAGRRIVVEVAGIGSTSEQASVSKLATTALGYAAGDVLRFSYSGGRVPGLASGSSLGAIAATTYGARESQNDLLLSGDRLASLLAEVARAAPGVPIDVVAHSQGGVVARLALAAGEPGRPLPAEVQTLVTLGTPHQGANAATAVDAIAGDPGGRILLSKAQQALGIDLDPELPAGRQLSQVSPVIDLVGARPVPDAVRFTSIGASGDVVVPALRTSTGDGRAHEVVLGITGLRAHDQLPGAPEATREVALAIGGRPPTCRSLAQFSADFALSDTIGLIEDRAGAAAAGVVATGPP